MASVRQIANQAGVSIATVSRVINNSPKVSEAARAKVLEVINQEQYKPKIGKLPGQIKLDMFRHRGQGKLLSVGKQHLHDNGRLPPPGEAIRARGRFVWRRFQRRGCGSLHSGTRTEDCAPSCLNQ